jgi:hypothetical protein
MASPMTPRRRARQWGPIDGLDELDILVPHDVFRIFPG